MQKKRGRRRNERPNSRRRRGTKPDSRLREAITFQGGLRNSASPCQRVDRYLTTTVFAPRTTLQGPIIAVPFFASCFPVLGSLFFFFSSRQYAEYLRFDRTIFATRSFIEAHHDIPRLITKLASRVRSFPGTTEIFRLAAGQPTQPEINRKEKRDRGGRVPRKYLLFNLPAIPRTLATVSQNLRLLFDEESCENTVLLRRWKNVHTSKEYCKSSLS